MKGSVGGDGPIVASDEVASVLGLLSGTERLLVVVDFDGTLSDIVDDPGHAAPVLGAVAALDALTRHAQVAILSGREVDDLAQRLGDLRVDVIGGHGSEVRLADGTRETLGAADVDDSVLRGCADAARAYLGNRAGWELEPKARSLAIHYRRADADDTGATATGLWHHLRATLPPGWSMLDGHKVIEVRADGSDKGTALRWLLARTPGLIPIVIGDDVTDEDAFVVANDLGGYAILVAPRPRETAATSRLSTPAQVVDLLERLAVIAGTATDDAPTDGDHRYADIGSYGMIGDSRTGALISPDGSVDWFCVPRFDSPSVFGAILDADRGGRFRIRPVGHADYEVHRSYLEETNVLVTTFARDGEAVLTLTDFLVYSRVNAFDATVTGHRLLRRVEAFGDVEVEIEFQPRFDYARAWTRLEVTAVGLRASAGSEHLHLYSTGVVYDVTEHPDASGHVARARLTMAPGEERWLRLETAGAERGPHLHLSADELLDLTVRTWRRWAALIDYDGPWRDLVVRSALVLKGLVYEPTGALVAAPTSSLPEAIGGVRNWDYRYAWIRDSAYVLECFLKIGHAREAETFIRWLAELSERIGGAHSLRPLYRITGEDNVTEFELPHLEGYRGSAPVRVGNGAASQLQLDIYGAAMQLGYLTELVGGEVPSARWEMIEQLVETVTLRWGEPDSGLWEIRSEPKHHTFSKFQCWLAIDRAIRTGRDLGLAAPYGAWQETAEEIKASILEHGYDEELGAFVQAYGHRDIDASVLLLPLRGFIPPDDPRVRSTVAAIRRELEIGEGLLLRYRTVDGLEGHEGAFLMCSFWMIELLARMGDLDEAERLFASLVARGGPLGLFAEELDPETGQHLGNFPQGFTHMSLIGAATAIDEERRARVQP